MEKDKRTLAALEGLWRALWDSLPPHEVARALERGAVRVKRFGPHSAQEVVVEMGTEEGWEERRFPLQAGHAPKRFCFVATGQEVLLETGSLIAKWGRVFVQVRSPSELEKALEEARVLSPLLASMDLGGLEGALEALATIEDGQTRTEGPYVLVRKGDLWTLGRGRLFGDPLLDSRFVAGREVTLSFPGGVAMGLKGDVTQGWMRIQEGYIRWGKEVSRLYCAGAAYFVNEGALRELLRCGLLGALDCAESSAMRVLIEELLKGEDPLEALKEEGLTERVKMDLLAEF